MIIDDVVKYTEWSKSLESAHSFSSSNMLRSVGQPRISRFFRESADCWKNLWKSFIVLRGCCLSEQELLMHVCNLQALHDYKSLEHHVINRGLSTGYLMAAR